MKIETELGLGWRAEFPILDTCTYLISNSLGAMPRRTRERLAQYADEWSTRGVTAWDAWLALSRRTADAVGALIGARAGEVILQQNVSVVEQILISCLDFSGSRNEVVYSDMEFPTVHYNWQAQTARGASVKIVRSADGVTVDTQALCDAICERTLAVPISHVLFRSSYIQDVKPIVEKAHAVGAYVFLDVYQSVGSVPIDVRELGVDACVGGCLKWLCGGPGTAFLWVKPELYDRLRPTAVGWFSHRRPFDFDMRELDFAGDAWRYAGGTPNPAAYYAALEGLKIISEVGVDAIRRRSVELTSCAVSCAQALGLAINSPLDAAARGGHVTVDFPGSAAACNELIRRKFIVDYRPRAGIRIAPHFYNSRDEVSAAFDQIRRLADGI